MLLRVILICFHFLDCCWVFKSLSYHSLLQKPVCEQLLSGDAFSSCQDLVDIDSFVQACVADMCHCDNSSRSFCLCNTISEYSRQCVHAGGTPQQWRTEQFCRMCLSIFIHNTYLSNIATSLTKLLKSYV